MRCLSGSDVIEDCFRGDRGIGCDVLGCRDPCLDTIGAKTSLVAGPLPFISVVSSFSTAASLALAGEALFESFLAKGVGREVPISITC